MCGAMLWIGKQDDSTNLQSIYSFHWWPPLQRRSYPICWRLVRSMLSNCSEMLETWQELDDLIFHGQWLNLHDRSQSGRKLVTYDWIAWYLTFITHVNMNSIVMWVILQNIAGLDCSKTPILQEILRIQNQHHEEHCAFLEVIHLFQSVGCVRNKLQFRTVQQDQKSFLWVQDWVWMVFRTWFMESDLCSSLKHDSESW